MPAAFALSVLLDIMCGDYPPFMLPKVRSMSEDGYKVVFRDGRPAFISRQVNRWTWADTGLPVKGRHLASIRKFQSDSEHLRTIEAVKNSDEAVAAREFAARRPDGALSIVETDGRLSLAGRQQNG